MRGALVQWIEEGAAQGRSGDATFGHEQAGHALIAGRPSAAAIDTAGDHDWYSITLGAGEQIVLDLSSAPGVNGTIGVHASNGNDLTPTATVLDGRGAILDFTAPASGEYLITVAAAGGGVGAYSLASNDATSRIGTAQADTLSDTGHTSDYRDTGVTEIFRGLDGDDTLSFARSTSRAGGRGFTTIIYQRTDTIYMDGGNGNDAITTSELTNGFISGGAGNDDIRVSAASAHQTVSLGSGSDTIHFGGVPLSYLSVFSLPYHAQITDVSTVVTDFAPGIDHFDTDSFVRQLGSGSGDPFASGQARLVQSGDDVLLQAHIGFGTSAQTDRTTVVTFQHAAATALTAADFGYTPVVATPLAGEVVQ